jgi:hypothetical protein
MKEALALLFQGLFSNIKDSKTLALRTVTMFIVLISYLIIMNQGELVQFAQTFSRSTVIEQVQGEREANFPKVAKERATMLFAQSRADEVVVAEYKPRFVNNYQDIVAWEGRLNVDPNQVLNSVLDKNSQMYSLHLLGKHFSYAFKEEKWGDGKFVTSGTEYTSIGAKFIYTCPIFNLDNSYSGYIGLVYRELPFLSEDEQHKIEEYLARICTPHARALGRKK